MQHLMAAFRTPKIRYAQLELLNEEIMAVSLESESGELLINQSPVEQFAAR